MKIKARTIGGALVAAGSLAWGAAVHASPVTYDWTGGSLTVLAIGASLALAGKPGEPPRGAPLSVGARKALLGCLLLVGAVTPLHEIARAALLPAWPINREATLIGAACGRYPAHYVARLGESRLAQAFEQLLRSPHALPLGHLGPAACENPAVRLMKERGLPWP